MNNLDFYLDFEKRANYLLKMNNLDVYFLFELWKNEFDFWDGTVLAVPHSGSNNTVGFMAHSQLPLHALSHERP